MTRPPRLVLLLVLGSTFALLWGATVWIDRDDEPEVDRVRLF